jgi:hypothetical protein
MAQMVLREHPDAILVYCDTGGEHPDNVRFLKDVEKWLNVKVAIIKSQKYTDHIDVCQKTKFISGPHGARCTVELKKVPRFNFQKPDDIQFFGYASNEVNRADRFRQSFPEVNARFPLIDARISHKDCVGILWKSGIELPMMYRLGYNNNNCIGCVKGGMGYWNKIRKDFPEVFDRMAKLEREIGATCIGSHYLDELDPEAGRRYENVAITCDFVCQSFGESVEETEDRLRRKV